ncbi:MAG: hypothetical protein DPW09_40300 [Anaerolineae bacterium]|nr:hypothetical protein [Anaerolineales bacterium]MCQ3979702.1 hypothetical protein [Anaerolineae bacterium]
MRQSPPADRNPAFVTRLMADVEPVLLDFIKTNVNSFIKWDLLRLFAANWDTLDTAENIARYVGRTVAVIEQELEDLVESGLIVKRGLNGASTYALVSDETTRATVSHFISACEDRDMRIKIVYHIVQGDHFGEILR